MQDAHINLADHDESHCRAIACEVLARRILRKLPHERLKDVLSTRHKWVQSDGTPSAPMCALELAIDQECTVRGRQTTGAPSPSSHLDPAPH